MGRATLIAAVADGAGSASCSEIGASLAVQTAVTATVDRLCAFEPRSEAEWLALLGSVFQIARHVVVTNAADMEIEPEEFATTLLLAIVMPERLAVGQIGDGAVVVRRTEGGFESVTRSASEYVNETTFLTSPTFMEEAQWVVRTGLVSGIALLSDGLQMLALKMPDGQPHGAFFAPLMDLLATAEMTRSEEQLEGFLQSPQIAQRADDDLTLVLAIPGCQK